MKFISRNIFVCLLLFCNYLAYGQELPIDISKEIIMDTSFSDVEIYNTLSTRVINGHKDIHIKLWVNNKTNKDQQLYLSVINPTLDKIEITSTNKEKQLLGDYESFRKRSFKHANHIYPFYLKKDSSIQIAAVLYNSKSYPLNARVKLSSENSFIKTTNHDYYFNGIYYGIFFLYIMLLICFYIFSRSNFFFIYVTINFFSLLLMMLYNGTGYQYIWFYSSKMQKYISVIAALAYLTSHILFIRSFFAIQLKNLSRYFVRILLIVIAVFGILIALQLYNYTANTLGNIYPYIVNGIFIFYGILVVLLSIYSYSESKSREALWVLTGVLFHLLNWVIFLNNEFALINWLNKLNNFRLYDSDIFLSHLNYMISLVEIFVITVFIAINYHKLIRQYNLSTQRIEFLHKRNINTFVLGLEDERSKITDEIQADISKDIHALQDSLKNIHLKHDEKKIIPALISEMQMTLADINNITGNYVAPDLQRMKLRELILTSTDKLNQKFKTQYNFDTIEEDFKLNAVANINLYRIFQEISNNALKHSTAKNISISTIKDATSLQIKIKDDGAGFGDMLKNKGIGLLNIESRMNSLNGNFYLLSNEKYGTTIHLIMALNDIL